MSHCCGLVGTTTIDHEKMLMVAVTATGGPDTAEVKPTYAAVPIRALNFTLSIYTETHTQHKAKTNGQT